MGSRWLRLVKALGKDFAAQLLLYISIAVWILGLLFHSTLPGLIIAIAGFTAINGLLMYWCYSLLDRAENRRQKAAAWGTMLLYLILLLLPSVIAVSMLARSYGAANM